MGTKLKVAILGIVALLGLMVAIPTSLTSVVITVAAIVGIVLVLAGRIVR